MFGNSFLNTILKILLKKLLFKHNVFSKMLRRVAKVEKIVLFQHYFITNDGDNFLSVTMYFLSYKNI